jgi:single-strand DNA-binding protein
MVPWTEEQLRKVNLMKNTVTLVGFVGNNPEVRTAQSGASITSISLATSRSFKDGEGNRQTETEWHRITCFNGIGKCVAEHVTKGAMVMVTGRIHYTRWTDSEGHALLSAHDPRLRDRIVDEWNREISEEGDGDD